MSRISVTNTAAFDDANELNAAARRMLGLGDHNTMKVAGMRFSREVDDFSFEIVRVHDGKFIMRLMANDTATDTPLKAHLEIALRNEAELIDLINKDQFWSGDYMRKMSQFVGYIGEGHVMRRLSGNTPAITAYRPTRGNNVAEAVQMEFRPGSVMSLQKPGSGQGLDILGYKTNPPPPGWVVADIKATARSAQDLAGFKTPRTPGLSTKQRGGDEYAIDIIDEALLSLRDGPNIFGLGPAEAANLSRLRGDLDFGGTLQGVVFRVGMREGFELASNSKYPEMILVKDWF